jgi:hypothetical protein
MHINAAKVIMIALKTDLTTQGLLALKNGVLAITSFNAEAGTV